MKTLIAGANLPLPSTDLQLTFNYRLQRGELDISAYLLAEKTGKVRGDQDMIFYGQKQTPNGAVSFENSAGKAVFRIQTNKIDPAIGKIAICATIDGAKNLSVLQNLTFGLESGGQAIANAETGQRPEAALILAEIYKHNGAWKCRWVMQGFNGGLQPLAEHFGVEIADEPTPPPAPEKKVNLSKITLDKRNSSISLEKKSSGFGQIRVNLNWNQNPQQQQKKGFLSGLLSGSGGIDLDLGAMIRLKNGEIYLVQALGNNFGNLNFPPFTELQGDDRTGAVSDGEWLFINGQRWNEISQVVIFCFIYEGVPNWAATDGVVRVYVPDQPEIEVQLTEGSNNSGMCGIVEFRNERDNIQVQRVVKYFPGHRELDRHFNFGFEWVRARK